MTGWWLSCSCRCFLPPSEGQNIRTHSHKWHIFIYRGRGIDNLVYRTEFCGTQFSETHKTRYEWDPTAHGTVRSIATPPVRTGRATLHLSFGEMRWRIRNGYLPTLQITVILGAVGDWHVIRQYLVLVLSRDTLNRIEITNKMRPCSRIYYSNVS